MSGIYPPDRPQYVIKPRTPKVPPFHHIIALSRDLAFVERTGEVHDIESLPAILAVEPSSIIACQDFGHTLETLKDAYTHDALFNYRITPRFLPSRKGYSANTRHPMIYDAICNYLGWKNSNPKKAGKYHYPLDPVVFCRAGIDELKPSEPEEGTPRAWKLYEWATEVRQWTIEQCLTIKPSSGGLVAQLLRDPRFYPSPRRKIPGALNDCARPQLPGNYYHLCAEPGVIHDAALYLDMSSAHHSVAAATTFPCGNSLHAYGNWRLHDDRIFATGVRMDRMLTRPGLFNLRVSSGGLRHARFRHPDTPDNGVRTLWAYSNELELVRESATITGIIAALTSTEADEGLRKYSHFAIGQNRAHVGYRPWLKPTLLSTYGVLAAKPVPFETGYLRAKSGTPVHYPMGMATLPALAHKTTKPIESRIANVIHRGMIEAGVRKWAIQQANAMHDDGWHVLAIYADSIFVLDRGRPPGLLEPPWRVAEELTNLRFDDATHWTSDQAARMPGFRRNRDTGPRLDRLTQRQLLLSSWAALNNRLQRRDYATSSKQADEARGAASSGREGR